MGGLTGPPGFTNRGLTMDFIHVFCDQNYGDFFKDVLPFLPSSSAYQRPSLIPWPPKLKPPSRIRPWRMAVKKIQHSRFKEHTTSEASCENTLLIGTRTSREAKRLGMRPPGAEFLGQAPSRLFSQKSGGVFPACSVVASRAGRFCYFSFAETDKGGSRAPLKTKRC